MLAILLFHSSDSLLVQVHRSMVSTDTANDIAIVLWAHGILNSLPFLSRLQFSISTHYLTSIFNLQQDAIVAVCSSPSLHLSGMGMALSTARYNRRCLLTRTPLTPPPPALSRVFPLCVDFVVFCCFGYPLRPTSGPCTTKAARTTHEVCCSCPRPRVSH